VRHFTGDPYFDWMVNTSHAGDMELSHNNDRLLVSGLEAKMSFVEWAEVALPLLVFGWGMCLVAAYPEIVDSALAKLDNCRFRRVGIQKNLQ